MNRPLDSQGSPARSTVILVSTRTVDRVPTDRGIVEIAGGPATYVAAALERIGRPYQLITGAVAEVEVILGPEGESYLIPALPPIQMPPRLAGAATILSPIMREIDPGTLPPVDGLLAIDLQGFVREPLLPSLSPGHRFDLVALLSRTDLVKASAGELRLLTDESIKALNRCVVVATEGTRGARVRAEGREAFIAARPVEIEHAIGAGDTFLAALVCAFLDSGDPFAAAERAARFTESMLQERVASNP